MVESRDRYFKNGKKTSRYPSRFGVIPHDFLTTLYQILHIIEKLAMDGMLRFHGMKYFVSYHETVCFKRRKYVFFISD